MASIAGTKHDALIRRSRVSGSGHEYRARPRALLQRLNLGFLDGGFESSTGPVSKMAKASPRPIPAIPSGYDVSHDFPTFGDGNRFTSLVNPVQ
jgi:hypothetical protein